MKQYKLEKFEGPLPRGDTKIAINKSGLIRISSGFRRTTKTENFKYVILFYDRSNNVIALKFTNIYEKGAFRATRDRTAATVSGTSFFKTNNLNLKILSGRYGWVKETVHNIGEVFIIELTKK